MSALRLGVCLFLLLVQVPTFVSAGLFPKSSLVKMIDAKGFREIMKLNVSVMALLHLHASFHCGVSIVPCIAVVFVFLPSFHFARLLPPILSPR